MKIWTVVMTVHSDPSQKVYLLGAHSSKESAKKHKNEVDDPPANQATIIEMELDGKQPPVLVGVEPANIVTECKKNTPNG